MSMFLYLVIFNKLFMVFSLGIKILQEVLLKVCLILGIKVHFPVTFQDIVEPRNQSDHWHVKVQPGSSPVASHSYDAIISADGKQYSLPGFHSKEFRAKLAIAITANFVNHRTNQETSVEEISGVAFIYNQSFFKELAQKHGIDLENIVYYKDETHYFVMTAKKSSLLAKGVIKNVSISSTKRPIHLRIVVIMLPLCTLLNTMCVLIVCTIAL